MTPDNPNLFEATDLSVEVAQTQILRGLNFEIHPGNMTGILGPNGSGKTTLLHTLSGALPYRGTVTYKDRPLRNWRRKKLAQQVAVMQQAPTISFDFTIRDFVLLGRMPHKKWMEGHSADDLERIEKILIDLELAELAHRTLPSLSGGERQRVYLAQALAQETETLFLDEPTSHLDIYYQFDLLKRLRKFVDEGQTIVAVFHDLELAARFADEILVLADGKLIGSGPPASTLTPALIRQVFRMDTRLVQSPDHSTHFHYLDNVPNEDLHKNR